MKTDDEVVEIHTRSHPVRADRTDETNPALEAFLRFLARDTAERSENLNAVDVGTENKETPSKITKVQSHRGDISV